MDTEIRSWAMGTAVRRSPFAQPRGALGRLAGWIMSRTNRHDELLPLLDVKPGHRVLEIGHGPGTLVRLLATQTRAAAVIGVDPSPAMRASTLRRNRAAVEAGRVVLRAGTAAGTGLPDGGIDRLVCVNNVAIWPDLEAGLREFGRVLSPGSLALIAWHGGTSPSRVAKRLQLPADKLARIESGLAAHVGPVTRHQLSSLDIFLARVPG